MKDVIVTGDRPTGHLHLGHYVGSLRNRKKLQDEGKYDMYIFSADMQGLTDNARDTAKIRENVFEVIKDNLSIGIDPEKVTIFDLSVTDVNAVDASSITLNNAVKEDILTSVILYDTVSKIIIDNNTLVKPVSSLEKNSNNTVTKIVDGQMGYILDVLIELGIADVSTNITVTFSDTVNSNISDSIILRATVSKTILENDNIKVATVNKDTAITDVTVITHDDMLDLLNALYIGLGLTDSSVGTSVSLPKKNDADRAVKLTAISNSQILRLSIAKLLKFNDNAIEIRILDTDSVILNNISGGTNNLIDIVEEEMYRLLDGIVASFGGSGNPSTDGNVDFNSLKAMTDDDKNIFYASNTLMLVSDKLLNNSTIKLAYTTYYGGTLYYEDVNVYNPAYATFSTVIPTEILTRDTQKDMISRIPSM